MRRFAFACLALSLTASAAFAAPKWSGVGWYQIVALAGPEGVTGWIHAGPFSGEDQCTASLPPSVMDSEGGVAYECQYLASQPDWDR